MTNMEGVGLLFVLIMIGVPLLLLIIIAAYLTHRSSLNPEKDDGIHPPKMDTPISIICLVRGIFLQPDHLFTDITDRKANLFRPFVLITISGIIFYIGFLSAFDESLILSGLLHGEIGNFLILGLGTSPLFVIPSYVAWIILSAGFFALSILFKGSGAFSKTLQNTGYGAAVYLFVSGAILVLSALIHQTLIFNHLVAFNSVPISLPPVLLYVGLILPLIGSVILWSIGLEHARKIPFSHAVISVSVVVFLGVLLLSWKTLLFFIGHS